MVDGKEVGDGVILVVGNGVGVRTNANVSESIQLSHLLLPMEMALMKANINISEIIFVDTSS